MIEDCTVIFISDVAILINAAVAIVIDCISAQFCCTGEGLAVVVVTILNSVAVRLGIEVVSVTVRTGGEGAGQA